jgi:hypothetical protein
MLSRVAFGIKISDTIDNEWANQPFVERRSGRFASFARPLATAQIAMDMSEDHGARVTAKRILRSILRRVRQQD